MTKHSWLARIPTASKPNHANTSHRTPAVGSITYTAALPGASHTFKEFVVL